MTKDAYYLDPRVAVAYDSENGERDIVRDDIAFYVGLAEAAAAAGHGVLELGAGTGRVTIPIARAGVSVVGLDSSPAMLAVARCKSTGLTNPTWVEGDMADFALDRRFGLAIIPFRSFLHLLTVQEQQSCLRRVREHLVGGGRLALNIFNPDVAILAARLNRKHGGREAEPGGTEVTRRYSTAVQTLEGQRRAAGSDAVISRIQRGLRLRYVFRDEMEHLLALSGFEVEALYGWFDRRPFYDHSSEMVWVARRPP